MLEALREDLEQQELAKPELFLLPRAMAMLDVLSLPAPELIPTEDIFERFKPPYTAETAQALLTYHQQIASINEASRSYYFHFTAETSGATGHLIMEPYHQLVMKGGALGCFSAAEMAVIIHEQIRAYIAKETMGHFPKDDPHKVQELVATMISGFDRETLMVAAQLPGEGKGSFSTPVAMVRATIGRGQTPIKDQIGDEHSNLPTLAGLTFPAELLGPELAETPSDQVVCISRFARSEDSCQYPKLPLMVLKHLGSIFQHLNQERPQALRQIIFDTHTSSGVGKMAEKCFGASILVGPSHKLEDGSPAVKPTQVIARSVLAEHYGNPYDQDENITGYYGEIKVMTTTIEDFITGGKNIHEETNGHNPQEKLQLELDLVLNKTPDKEKPTLEQLRPVIIDRAHPKPEDIELLRKAKSKNTEPLRVGREELLKLAAYYRHVFSTLPQATHHDPEALQDEVIKRETLNIDEDQRATESEQLKSMFGTYDNLFKDLLGFAHEVVAEAEKIASGADNARLLFWPETNEVTEYISLKVHTLLQRSRMLGLVPYEALDKLATLNIKILGASVAAQPADLLVSYGAGHLTIADSGTIDPSNAPRLTTAMADVTHFGEPKVVHLVSGLYHRQPYGDFNGINGMVTTENLEDFVQGADLLIEVIDSPKDKIGLRLKLLEKENPVKVIFVADISPIPVAGFENLSQGFFNQKLKTSDWEGMLGNITGALDPIQAQAASLLAITEMLGSHITETHAISTIQIVAGLQPFLSQDPGDSRLSAVLTARLILDMVQGKVESGKTFNLGQLQATHLKRERDRLFMLDVLHRNLGGR